MQEPMMGSWMLRMLCALWLVVAHDLLEYRYGWRPVKFVLFNLYCSTWRGVLKMFASEIISNLASESLEIKFSRSYLQRRKLGKSRQKRVLDNLEMSKLQEIFTTVTVRCHRVSSLRETRCFAKFFRKLFCFEQERTFKDSSKKLTVYN